MVSVDEVKSGDYLECMDGNSFIVRNGKLLGPTAWMTTGMGKWTIKYQSSSLEGVINEVNKNHVISSVITGRLHVLLRIIS
ncbi:hypothetical protein JOC85_003706 [Bacillus mesophilus]|uniref:Uncharacterized protein n=1 Tax=Bacillus mesophilus TaxID=1808955 RepID=A0A6M0QAU5_9BACI|nr:hypothetical protein [Bacillus mesophilus]MBM7662895.1 hypothetical protein [Bacillus mesophilus]NEY73484.1 hypothetical protein [Bacillus mesophilus]